MDTSGKNVHNGLSSPLLSLGTCVEVTGNNITWEQNNFPITAKLYRCKHVLSIGLKNMTPCIHRC